MYRLDMSQSLHNWISITAYIISIKLLNLKKHTSASLHVQTKRPQYCLLIQQSTSYITLTLHLYTLYYTRTLLIQYLCFKQTWEKQMLLSANTNISGQPVQYDQLLPINTIQNISLFWQENASHHLIIGTKDGLLKTGNMWVGMIRAVSQHWSHVKNNRGKTSERQSWLIDIITLLIHKDHIRAKHRSSDHIKQSQFTVQYTRLFSDGANIS